MDTNTTITTILDILPTIYTNILPTMGTITLTAIISVGASITASIVFTLWTKHNDDENNKKKNEEKFKTYKNYAIEFLKVCISIYDGEKFVFLKNTYNLDELKIIFIKKPTDTKLPISEVPQEQLIPLYVLGFMSKEYILNQSDTWLLRRILDDMSSDRIWFFMDNDLLIYRKNIEGNILTDRIAFRNFCVEDKDRNALFFFTDSCNILLTKNTDKEYLEKLLKELESNKLDQRIKKTIEQWQIDNTTSRLNLNTW